jgi:GNAT superfamily N-acetyltransferase
MSRMPSKDRPDVQIRSAAEGDIRLILTFIRKLAEYGDIADEVSATEDDVSEALFGRERVADAIIAYLGPDPVGFAIYSYTFSSFHGRPGIYVEDLFVEQACRGSGVGKALLVYIAQVGRQRRCARLEWSVLNWNERAMEFYQELGAVPMEEWTTFRMTGDALERLALADSATSQHPQKFPVTTRAQTSDT